MEKISILLFLIGSSLLGFIPLNAQRKCGTQAYLQWQNEQDRRIKNKRDQIESFTLENFSSSLQFRSIITIPVVVHLIYSQEVENLSDGQIQSQITVLNEDFRRLNEDKNDKWPQAADTQIEFCLANTDPKGKPTTGIERRRTPQKSFGPQDDIKFYHQGGLDAWPSDDYLNIWVGNLTSNILGFAQFPGGPANTDGVVIDYRVFGRMDYMRPPFHLGRTCTHEVGHWLNLKHIWGNGGCHTDDGTEDTPLAFGPNYGCRLNATSCKTVDMKENFMDYSNDACMNLFTKEQGLRMRTLFLHNGFRASLLHSDACSGHSVNIKGESLTTKEKIKLRISPNPVGEVLYYDIQFEAPKEEEQFESYSLIICTISLQLSHRKAITYFTASGQFSITHLIPGIYFAILLDKNGHAITFTQFAKL